mmetsp:Transcript_94581/g.207009  ORF Transcript_94581/g.207009 Transcript_94581/m.207009 type:complete len:423 (+) Transcript_94581:1-1269(+)
MEIGLAAARANPAQTVKDGMSYALGTILSAVEAVEKSPQNRDKDHVADFCQDDPEGVLEAHHNEEQARDLHFHNPFAHEKPPEVGLADCINSAAAGVQAEILDIQSWVHESHFTLRFICFCLAICLEALAVVTCFGFLIDEIDPFRYLFAAYNIIFANVIMVLDGRPTRCVGCTVSRRKLFEACWFLTHTRGRALLYFYVGSINVVIGPFLQRVVGAALFLAGCLILSHGCICCRKCQKAQGVDLNSFEEQAAHGLSVIQEAGVAARLEFMKIKAYCHRNPVTFKILCTFVGFALFAVSGISLINIFGIFTDPFQYLIAGYNVIFACIIVLVDGPQDWLDPCKKSRRFVYEMFPCMAWLSGRGCFFIYVGSFNFVVLPEVWLWRVIYWAVAGSLILMGLLMLGHRYICRSKRLDAIIGAPID